MRSARSSRDTSSTLVSVVPASLPAPPRYTALSTVATDTVTATPPGYTHTVFNKLQQFSQGGLLIEAAVYRMCGGRGMIGRVVIFSIRSSVMFNVYAQIMKYYVTSQLP